MKMPISKEWLQARAAAEGDLEIGAGGGRLTMTVDLDDNDVAEMERVALEGLPAWARERIVAYGTALMKIRDADDVHPSSTAHEVEMSRARFRTIAREALDGLPQSTRTTPVADDITASAEAAARKVLKSGSESFAKGFIAGAIAEERLRCARVVGAAFPQAEDERAERAIRQIEDGTKPW